MEQDETTAMIEEMRKDLGDPTFHPEITLDGMPIEYAFKALLITMAIACVRQRIPMFELRDALPKLFDDVSDIAYQALGEAKPEVEQN